MLNTVTTKMENCDNQVAIVEVNEDQLAKIELLQLCNRLTEKIVTADQNGNSHEDSIRKCYSTIRICVENALNTFSSTTSEYKTDRMCVKESLMFPY